MVVHETRGKNSNIFISWSSIWFEIFEKAHRAWKISEKTLFSGQAQVAKILNDKKYFNTGENLQGNSVFQGKRKFLKTPEW